MLTQRSPHLLLCGWQGQEKEYIVKAEQEKLKKLREQLAKQRAHMDDVEAALNELGGEDGKDKK